MPGRMHDRAQPAVLRQHELFVCGAPRDELERHERRVFGDLRVAARAVHPAAAGVHERAPRPQRVEQRFERGALDGDAFGGIFHRAVHHRVGLRGFRAQRVEIAHLAAHGLGAERAQLLLRRVAARERAHGVRASAQLAHDARADVARTARDEDRHDC